MYTQEITRCHRAAIVIAIDQSCSMSERLNINGCNLTKAEAVSLVTGRLLNELLLRSRRDGECRNYYDIAIIGYNNDEAYSLLGDDIDFLPITLLAKRPVRKRSFALQYTMPDGKPALFFEEVPMWVEPRAEGSTPMYKMLTKVFDMVYKWCSEPQNRNSFPPIVFNITDGEASDATATQLIEAAKRIRNICTNDGNTLFVNVHLTSYNTMRPTIFPRPNEIYFESRCARTLAEMSSEIPQLLEDYAMKCRGDFALPPFLAMSYNASISELVLTLNIGTRSLTPMI